MRNRSKWLTGIGVFLLAGMVLAITAAGAYAGESSLAYFQQAKINWRQFEGQKLTIGLNKHPYTESLLPPHPAASKTPSPTTASPFISSPPSPFAG